MTLIEKIVCYGVIALAIAICVFMFIHTIIEIRKLNKQIAIIDIIKDGEKVGGLTLDKSKLDYCIGDGPIEYHKDEYISIIIEKRNTGKEKLRKYLEAKRYEGN